MIAVDHLATEVIKALSSGYCPESKTLFLIRLSSLVSIFCAIGAALIVVAGFRLKNSTLKIVAYTSAAILIVFAIGGGALDLFGLSGCSGTATKGLTWDWPW